MTAMLSMYTGETQMRWLPMPLKCSLASLSTMLLWLAAAACLGWLFWAPGKEQTSSRSASLQVATQQPELKTLFETDIRKPVGPPMVHSGLTDPHGQPVMINCNTCHATKSPNNDLRLGASLTEFHQGLKGQHGNLTCVSCHNPQDGYQSLRLADGKLVPYVEVMQLCAQCHGPQYRDYQHGAHGGMTGYWDLTKGPRQRNNCIDCHDPHHPKYPVVRPAQGPQDRALSRSQHSGGGHE